MHEWPTDYGELAYMAKRLIPKSASSSNKQLVSHWFYFLTFDLLTSIYRILLLFQGMKAVQGFLVPVPQQSPWAKSANKILHTIEVKGVDG